MALTINLESSQLLTDEEFINSGLFELDKIDKTYNKSEYRQQALIMASAQINYITGGHLFENNQWFVDKATNPDSKDVQNISIACCLLTNNILRNGTEILKAKSASFSAGSVSFNVNELDDKNYITTEVWQKIDDTKYMVKSQDFNLYQPRLKSIYKDGVNIPESDLDELDKRYLGRDKIQSSDSSIIVNNQPTNETKQVDLKVNLDNPYFKQNVKEVIDNDPNLKGDTGPAGPQGVPGPMGPKGEVGATGPMGMTGPQGIQGPKGDKGDKGDQGLTGPQGPKGDTGSVGPAGKDGAIQYKAGQNITISSDNVISSSGSGESTSNVSFQDISKKYTLSDSFFGTTEEDFDIEVDDVSLRNVPIPLDETRLSEWILKHNDDIDNIPNKMNAFNGAHNLSNYYFDSKGEDIGVIDVALMDKQETLTTYVKENDNNISKIQSDLENTNKNVEQNQEDIQTNIGDINGVKMSLNNKADKFETTTITFTMDDGSVINLKGIN